MRLVNAVLSLTLVVQASCVPLIKRVAPELVPEFGVQAGANPTGTGDCDGIAGPNGKPIKIPCACPPDRGAFLQALNANVAAGHAVNNPGIAVSFPTGNAKGDRLARIEASIVTLQNLRGPGQGCPAASTTFVAQRAAIQNGQAPPPSGPPPAPAPKPQPKPAAPRPGPPPPPAPAAAGDAAIAALAPDLGFKSGLNPTGTGDCDGAVKGANGQPIKIPCFCPPNQPDFVKALTANVKAGHAVNNPGIGVKFPTGNSNADKIARIQAGLVTLQNLRGPGVGCPAVSSTLLAQQKALSG